MRPHALHPGTIHVKEGIKFCHLATLSRNGHSEIVKELLASSKIDVTLGSANDGKVAIEEAAKNGHNEVVLLLISWI